MQMLRSVAVLALAAACGACASYDGHSLVAGKSTQAEVEATMGRPDDRVAAPGGGSDWFYKRPAGRQTFVVQLGADGVVRGVEQRLDSLVLARLSVGASKREDVRALLGPPDRSVYFERLKRDTWEYRSWKDTQEYYIVVQFSDDGLVREVFEVKEYVNEPGGDKD